MTSETHLKMPLWDAASPTEQQRPWSLISDGVMGGKSRGNVVWSEQEGQPCARLHGTVSLDNNGGFLQMVQYINTSTAAELPGFEGIFLDVFGNTESYGVHLRTQDNWLPWQAYRAQFTAEPAWQTLYLPFDSFEAYRTRKPFKPERLRQIGIVAIGREFKADLCIGRIGFYQHTQERTTTMNTHPNGSKDALYITGEKKGTVEKKPFHKDITRVFYDGGCPLCRKEIKHYRQLPGCDRLEWIDIADPEADLGHFGLDRFAAMTRLHVLDAHAQWQTGAWAFAAIWSELPRYRWLASILHTTRSLPLLDRAYTLFAQWRLRRRCAQSTDDSVNAVCLVPTEARSKSAAPHQGQANPSRWSLR